MKTTVLTNGQLKKVSKIFVFLLVSHLSTVVSVGQQFSAAYSPGSSPVIDGVINPGEWNANTYEITFYRTDGGYSHTGYLYLQHDLTWFYIGLNSHWNSGWDVYVQLRFDGNNDHNLNGNDYIPHTDFQIECPSYNGWSGYRTFNYLVGTNSYPSTEPSGTERESAGTDEGTYEFKIKIEDLNVNSSEVFGFYMLHGTDGTSPNNYEFPLNNVRNNPSQWTNVLLSESTVTTINETPDTWISIYPNPLTNYVNISVNNTVLIPSDIFVFNSKGMPIKAAQINSQKLTLDCLENCPSGLYFVIIKNQNHHIVKPISKL